MAVVNKTIRESGFSCLFLKNRENKKASNGNNTKRESI
jgi:hypothetical protein